MTRADEVDFMLISSLPSNWLHVTYEGAPPGFCFVELKSIGCKSSPDQTCEGLQALCCHGRVSSTQFRNKVFKVLEDAVKEERRAKGKLTKIIRRRIHSGPQSLIHNCFA